MRLRNAQVRNYRIHRDTRVDFSDSLTLVGGPNESGKSTLAEALHRALFLKSTVGGKVWEEMQSTLHPGNPEIELDFEADGTAWNLKKVFARSSGKTVLTESGKPSLQGTKAEAKLADLMQVEEAGGGKGGTNKALAQWSHLWVWQGSGGDDPSEHTLPQRDALLSRLEEQGGGAALQSERDAAVAATIQEEYDALFTKSGQPKAGSSLQKAIEEQERAEEAAEIAEGNFARLASAARDVEEAEKTLGSGESSLASIASALTEARERDKKAATIRQRLQAEEAEAGRAAEDGTQFQKALEEVRKLTKQRDQLASAPSHDAVKESETKLKKAKEKAKAKRESFEKAEIALSRKREERELAEAWGHLLKHRETLAQQEKQAKAVDTLRASRARIEETLARLPPVDEATFRNLQTLDEEAERASAVLEAMSTEVEILEAETDVQVGGESLGKGDSRVLDEETLIESGPNQFRIVPGGGSRLDDARTDAKRLRSRREEAFKKLGITTLEEAGEIRAQRAACEKERETVDQDLARNQAEEIEASLAETRQAVAAYEEEVKRRSPQLPDFSPPDSPEEARSLWESLRDSIAPLESALTDAREQQDSARLLTEQAETDLEEARSRARTTEQSRIEIEAELKARSERLGPEDERESRLRKLQQTRDEAEARLKRTREEFAALQPDSIRADIERLTRSEQQQRNALSAAREKRAAAESLLRNDGTLDPAAVLATSRAHLESATERRNSIERRARAIKMLRDAFASEQQALSEQFSRPLAGAVSKYLQQIFGATARAGVAVEDGQIGNWTMTRTGETFAFDHLSGGTREQVAAAVRLAVAELLAPDHGGHLPIVFDDAFTNSDPDRIRNLQRMLDLAARSGLQVVLLTCDPEDYTELGASTVLLDRPGSSPTTA